jgi:HK97 family phage major capsid protein
MSGFPEIKAAIDDTAAAFTEFRKTQSKRLDGLSERIEELEAKGMQPGRTVSGERVSKEAANHADRFKQWLRRPHDEQTKRDLAQAQSDLEQKDVTIGTGSAGGFALPEEIDRRIEHRVRQLDPFRSLVRVTPIGSSDFKALVSMGDGTSGWVAESATRTGTTSPTLREVAPTMGTVYAYPTASEESVQDIFFNVSDWLVQEAADEFASAEATAIISGNGSSKPTGFLNTTPTNVADDPVSRAAGVLQYIPSGHASLLTGDGLIDLAVGAIKEKYLAGGDGVAWVMSRSTLAAVRKLKGSTNDAYLWQPGLGGQPATLLGYPVFTCDAMPAVGANNFPIAFGNWNRGYILVDRGGTRITVDDNLTTPGKVKFYVRRRVGGIILNNDAIKVTKVATT